MKKLKLYFQFKEVHDCMGEYDRTKHTITIKSDMGFEEFVKVMYHEFTHFIIDHLRKNKQIHKMTNPDEEYLCNKMDMYCFKMLHDEIKYHKMKRNSKNKRCKV